MWILLVLTLAVMSALTVIQTPREWLKNKLLRIVILIYHTVGITSIALILFAVCRMKDGLLREIIIWTETFYLTLTVYALLLSAVRYFGFELARHFKHRKILHILSNQMVFLLAVVLISAAYMIPSVHNATNLKTAAYDIHVNKNCGSGTLCVAVVSDFHVGAGARHREMDQMRELLTAAEPDLILIDGDVCDSSSSVYDLEYMEATLKKLDCRYGIFYAEGNHEAECITDPEPYLSRAGVTVLKDKGVRLENGVNIIGRKNALKTSVAQIMGECGLDPGAPTVVLQHRTKGLSHLEGVADLAVCGHTHGYQFPFIGVLMPYQRDISYGHRMYGETNVIVSAGVAEWGYRTKWPSQSEVTVININFKEAKQ